MVENEKRVTSYYYSFRSSSFVDSARIFQSLGSLFLAQKPTIIPEHPPPQMTQKHSLIPYDRATPLGKSSFSFYLLSRPVVVRSLLLLFGHPLFHCEHGEFFSPLLQGLFFMSRIFLTLAHQLFSILP